MTGSPIGTILSPFRSKSPDPELLAFAGATAAGHEDQYPQSRVNGRGRFGNASDNDKVAPKAEHHS
jgi:hypothetical protein